MKESMEISSKNYEMKGMKEKRESRIMSKNKKARVVVYKTKKLIEKPENGVMKRIGLEIKR